MRAVPIASTDARPNVGPGGDRAGFSVLEAIIVLAITSLALVLVFSIGARATQTGFRLGRRALGVADAQIDVASVRAVLDGVLVPPPHGQGLVLPDFDGERDRLQAGASFPRATACGDPGPAGVVTLTIVRIGARAVLECATSQSGNAGAAVARPLAELGMQAAAFSYSLDGVTWSDGLHIPGGAGATVDPRLAFSETRDVWVRLSVAGGGFEVIEALSSGRPPPPKPESAGAA